MQYAWPVNVGPAKWFGHLHMLARTL